MAISCAIRPKVKNKQGEIVDSRLFKDLLSYSDNDRDTAVRIYEITKSQEFIDKWNPRLEMDENGEPTIISLFQKTNLYDRISQQKVLKKLNKDIGFYKRGYERATLWLPNAENRRKLQQKAISFNTTSPFRVDYVAEVVNIYDNSETGNVFIGVKVSPRNKLNSLNSDKMSYDYLLNQRLMSILNSYGVSVGALDELEERMGINGVTDFDKAKTAADGLVELIRIAKGERGQKALPEEFAHFILEAMKDQSLVNRLINLLNQGNLVQEILGEDYNSYAIQYQNDQYKLAKEAAGKLLAQHLLREQSIPQKPYKNLLQRVIDAIKEFFKKWNISDIEKAKIEADKSFGELAKQILGEGLGSNVSISNIRTTNKLYQLNSSVERDKKLLSKIIDNELKRLKIYESRSMEQGVELEQRQLVDALYRNLNTNTAIEGIYTFLNSAINQLVTLSEQLTTINRDTTSTLNDRAKVLRDARNYLYSYQNILKSIREEIVKSGLQSDTRYDDRIKTALDQTQSLLENIFITYEQSAMPLFVQFIKPFIGNEIKIPFGKYAGKRIVVSEETDENDNTTINIAKIASEDISFFDRWLDSMADSSDYMLKIMDQAVKKAKENARLDTISIQKKLEALAIKLEQSGIKDTDWMFERDSQGNLTGEYISEYNRAQFKEVQREMYKRLKDKYGANPVGEDAKKYKEEVAKWYEENTIKVGDKRIPSYKYKNTNFPPAGSAKREFYDAIMQIKSSLDGYLPPNYTTTLNTVKIRKDLIERVKDSKDIKSGAIQIWESIKDDFIRRTDDNDFGSKATVKDFEGNQVQLLPIYYTKLREGESHNDISTDIVSTMVAYAAMANDFHQMNKIIDVLELSRDMLKEREVVQTEGGSPLKETFKQLGQKVESTLTKKGEATRITQRLNDFFDMQVYGRYMKDEGTFGKSNIDKGKTANFVNKMTALNSLALNVLSGISNVATGRVMMRIESIAGEFFNVKNSVNADKIYAKELPSFLAEIGSRNKTSKLALWNQLFNVMQEYEQDVKEVNWDRKTWYSRMFGQSTLFFMNNAGEHWMQSRTSLSLGDAFKMKSPSGEIVSLWDAMEVVYKDPNNKKLGAELKVKRGYTKEDGTEFTREDIIAFSRKNVAINQRMHGIYNKADRNALQAVALGRMAMLYRKWIKPSLNRRFAEASYNFDMQAWTEGYYRTTAKFLWQVIKDLKDAQFAIGSRFNELTPTEKANIIRACTEVANFGVICLSIFALENYGDDNKEKSYFLSMLEYQLRRLRTELGALIPGKSMLEEGLRIIKSPAAGIRTLESTLDLIGIINPGNWVGEDAIMQSGRFEGKPRGVKLIVESPLLPMNKTIYKGLHPEESIPFYKQ